MKTSSIILIICTLMAECDSQIARCETPTADGTGTSVTTLQPCITQRRPPVDRDNYGDYGDTSEENFFEDSATYLFVIVVGVIALPATLVVRLCWTRKLQQRRLAAVNTAREITNRRADRQRRDIFTVDIDGMEYPVIPTYEESLANPGAWTPPKYDELPPCYADIVKESTKDDECQPSTSDSIRL